MATTILAGNATNGLALTPDNTGILEIKTGTGAGTTALTLNASQNATVAGTLTVGSTLQVAGVATNMYPIVSGTAVTASGTSVNFTGIPSWVKRITVLFNGVSTGGTGNLQVQLGTGVTPTYTISGYSSYYANIDGTNTTSFGSITTGFIVKTSVTAAGLYSGTMLINLLTGNTWQVTNSTNASNGILTTANGFLALAAALTSVRVIGSATGNPSDTFDAGTINILYE